MINTKKWTWPINNVKTSTILKKAVKMEYFPTLKRVYSKKTSVRKDSIRQHNNYTGFAVYTVVYL